MLKLSHEPEGMQWVWNAAGHFLHFSSIALEAPEHSLHVCRAQMRVVAVPSPLMRVCSSASAQCWCRKMPQLVLLQF